MNYQCGFRLHLEEGAEPYLLVADTPQRAAEKFADYAHARLGAWEWDSNQWDGERAIAVRPLGREDYVYFNVQRHVVPEFTAIRER